MSSEQITLADLVEILGKHKKLYWSIFLTFLISGVIWIALLPDKYKFTQSINIAHYSENLKDGTRSSAVSLLDGKTVIATIKNIYIPQAINNYNDKHSQSILLNDKDVSVSLNGDSANISGLGSSTSSSSSATIGDIVFLSAEASLQHKGFYIQLFSSIFDQITASTKPICDVTRKNLINQIAELEKYMELQKKNDVQGNNSPASISRTTTLILKQRLDQESFYFFKLLTDSKYALGTLQDTRIDAPFIAYKVNTVSKFFLIILVLFTSLLLSFIVVIIVNSATQQQQNNTR